MLAALLQPGGQTNHVPIAERRHKPDGDEHGLSLRERSRFIENDRVHLPQHFQGLSFFDQHTGRRTTPRAHHDRHRRRQAQRTRAGDDQHRHGIDQRIGQLRLRPPHDPGESGQHCGGHHQRHKVPGSGIRHALNRRPAPLRVADHLHDPREQRIPTDFLRLHQQTARAVHRPAGDRRADRFFHRHRFTGNHGLIDGGPAIDHNAIDGNPFSRPHTKPVPDLHLLEGHVDFTPIPHDPRGRRRQPQQPFDSGRSLAPRAKLQDLAEQHQDGNHRGRFEVDRHAAAVLME